MLTINSKQHNFRTLKTHLGLFLQKTRMLISTFKKRFYYKNIEIYIRNSSVY